MIEDSIEVKETQKQPSDKNLAKFSTARNGRDIQMNKAISPSESYNTKMLNQIKRRKSSQQSMKGHKHKNSNDEAFEGKFHT